MELCSPVTTKVPFPVMQRFDYQSFNYEILEIIFIVSLPTIYRELTSEIIVMADGILSPAKAIIVKGFVCQPYDFQSLE